ncbi:uncharacterized protein DUF4349 [Flavobacterium endophyticum]|uniref:Uncharacterized protein DUF4349 n=1 Tax=Flavobacterium endophyticum TaxID=1540163 RepID=A0A495MPS5_9FLAO|nr:DUF4349 domain-containing protein [Flavobacterium endophyticum]RKS26349.1 uncharacterized protein DUF4349 [Flavobacterium endophyticum]
MKTILPIFILFFLFSCKNDVDNMEAVYVSAAEMSEPMADKVSYAPSESSSPEIEQKIIKTAKLTFETDDLAETTEQVRKAVKENKASIEKDVEGKNNHSIYRKITVRIPNQNFEAFITAVGKGISYFDEKEISSDDVTAEFIDTEARLKAKKTLEARYLELLKKAGKVSEILEIEKELSTIREEIESKEGQLKYMQSQVAMSSVYLEFYKTKPAESGVAQSYGNKMGNALETGFLKVSSLFLWILNVWPFILILVVLFFIIRRRFKRKKA